VSFEQVDPRPALGIEHLLRGEPVGQGEGDRWRGEGGGSEEKDAGGGGVRGKRCVRWMKYRRRSLNVCVDI